MKNNIMQSIKKLIKLKWFIRFLKENNYYFCFKHELSFFIYNIDSYYSLPLYQWCNRLMAIRRYYFLSDSILDYEKHYRLTQIMSFQWYMFLYDNNLYDNVFEGFEKLYNESSYWGNEELHMKLKKLLNKK